MLVEQEQDLRKLGEDWRMTIYQHNSVWQVRLHKYNCEVVYYGESNNPKRAFKNAFRKAQAYEDSLKKSS